MEPTAQKELLCTKTELFKSTIMARTKQTARKNKQKQEQAQEAGDGDAASGGEPKKYMLAGRNGQVLARFAVR